MSFVPYVCCQSGLELTFRLEYQIQPGEPSTPFGWAGATPGSSPVCWICDACCLAICEPDCLTSRLATPAERRDWGDWLLARIELDRLLQREIVKLCLEATSEALPPARYTRVAARWKRAA